ASLRRAPSSILFPYTTLFRSLRELRMRARDRDDGAARAEARLEEIGDVAIVLDDEDARALEDAHARDAHGRLRQRVDARPREAEIGRAHVRPPVTDQHPMPSS